MTSLREERINPLLVWGAAAASLLIHGLLIFGLRKIPIVSPGALLIEPPERRVALRFIDSPERIEPVEEIPLTDLVSDRDSLAQDVIPDRVEVDESPRAVGIARESSVRKEPGGEPQPIQPPGREAETAPERLTGVGSRDDQVVPRKQSPAKPATESPIVARGEDKFYSPEEDSPEGRARILKQISYNMRSNEVGKYLSRLKPRVVNLWHFNVMQSTFYVRSGLTHVLFKILPDGSVGKVMVNKHDGPDLEMRYGLNAIKMAQPYEPLSPEVLDYIKDDGLWLEFRFQYR